MTLKITHFTFKWTKYETNVILKRIQLIVNNCFENRPHSAPTTQALVEPRCAQQVICGQSHHSCADFMQLKSCVSLGQSQICLLQEKRVFIPSTVFLQMELQSFNQYALQISAWEWRVRSEVSGQRYIPHAKPMTRSSVLKSMRMLRGGFWVLACLRCRLLIFFVPLLRTHL